MLSVEHLHKTYGGDHGRVTACNDLTFEVGEGEIIALVGESGCGKTSALRSVAGLERPDAGRITIGGEAVFDGELGIDVPAHRRSVGMVFQSYAIWPHLNVFENVAYPLRVLPRRSRPSRAVLREQVLGALERVRIPHLADRSASALSGGQQQRVAIARALVRDARLLLFDEPLSNLDARLREEMRGELRELFQSERIAVLYVTHDISEALAIGDRLLVLDAGEVLQAGVPEEIYAQPATDAVASFFGNVTLLGADVLGYAERSVLVETAFGKVAVESDRPRSIQGRATVLVRPESVLIRPAQDAAEARPIGRVASSSYLGTAVEYRVECSGELLRVRSGVHESRFMVDDLVSVELDERGVVLIAPPPPANPALTRPLSTVVESPV